MKEYRPWRGDTAQLDRARVVHDINQSLHRWALYIARELATIAAIDEYTRAYHALTFAIVSPRCPFGRNVSANVDLVRALQFGAPARSIENILRYHGIGLAYQKSHRLVDARPMLERFTPDRALLLALRGVGPKVSAMALALYDASLPVVTIDTHMLAGLTGENVNAISNARYARLERFALECMADPGRTVAPLAPPFAMQWALWADYSGKGFTSHLPIFGLEPE